MDIDLDDLIEDCKDRQFRWDGLNLDTCPSHESAMFMRNQMLALIVECTELLNSWQWKSWAAPNEQGKLKVTRGEMLAEVADVFYFLGNILAAGGVKSREIQMALEAKRNIIESRQASGVYKG